jgi:hypothetical protein
MKESCVNHPEDSKFLIFRAHYVAICEGNFCAAALLHVFETFHNYRSALQPMAQRNNKLSENKNQPRSQDETLWQHHSQSDLESYILGIYKRDNIIKAIQYLERKGFIKTGSNPLHPFDRTTHYLFHPKAVQAAIRFHEKSANPPQSRKFDNVENKGENQAKPASSPETPGQSRKFDNPSSENRQSLSNTNNQEVKDLSNDKSLTVVGKQEFANDGDEKVVDQNPKSTSPENAPQTASNDAEGKKDRGAGENAAQGAPNAQKKANSPLFDPEQSADEEKCPILGMNKQDEIVFWATVANHPKKKRMPRPSEKQKKAIKEIFQAWARIMNARSSTKLNLERARNIYEALLSYSSEEIIRACYGLLLSPHYLGVNDQETVYADIALICRDYGARIEKFLEKVHEFTNKGGKLEDLSLKGELEKIKLKKPAELKKLREKIENEKNQSNNRTNGKESIIEREDRNKNRIADSLEHFGFATNRNDSSTDSDNETVDES